MKAYEYKTNSFQTYVKPVSTEPNFGFSSQKTYGHTTNYSDPYANNQRINTQVNRGVNPIQNVIPGAQQGVNINEMRKKLDMLIQETDTYQSRKTIPTSRITTLQPSAYYSNTQDKNPILDTNKSQLKKIQLSNSTQRYEQNKPTRERLITEPVSSYQTRNESSNYSLGKYSQGAEVKTTIVPNKNFSSNQFIQKYYGGNLVVDDKNKQRGATYSISQPKQKSEETLSYKSFNQTKRQPVSLSSRIQNPQKQNVVVKNIVQTSSVKPFYSPSKQQTKKSYQPTYAEKYSTNNYSSSYAAKTYNSYNAINLSNQNKEQEKPTSFSYSLIPEKNTVSTVKQADKSTVSSFPLTSQKNTYNVNNQIQRSANISHSSFVTQKKSAVEIKQMSATKVEILQTSTQAPTEKTLNSKIPQLEQKLKRLEGQNQKLKQNVKNLSESKQYYRQQYANSNKNTNKFKQEYEQKIKLLKNQQNKLIQQKNAQVAKISKENGQKIYSIQQKHYKEIQQLRAQLQKRQQKIVHLVKQLGEKQGASQRKVQHNTKQESQNMTKYKLSAERKQFQVNKLQNELNSKQKEIQMLNDKIKEQRTQIDQLRKFKIQTQTQKYASFDQILMSQLKQMTELKDKIEQLNEKNNQLRSESIEQRRRNDSLQNQMKIMELKNRTYLNNLRMQSEIAITNKDNIIGSLNKKMITLEEKIKLANNEIKNKDQFVKQHLVGRTDSLDTKQYIQNILSKYQSAFSQSKEHQLVTQLQKARKKLELYEKY